uniref:Uncharacterized protein n=1 Tax=Meloidogyne incognita TaxID=6306 RepID=A0A914M2W8_MELIC
MSSKSKVSGRSSKKASRSHNSNKTSSSSESPPVTIWPPTRLQCVRSSTGGNISERTTATSCSSAGKRSGVARLSFTFEEETGPRCSSKPTCSRSVDNYKKSHKPLPPGVHRVELFGHFTKVALEGHILWEDCKCVENKARTSSNTNNINDDDNQE